MFRSFQFSIKIEYGKRTGEHELQQEGNKHDVTDAFDRDDHALYHMLYESGIEGL